MMRVRFCSVVCAVGALGLCSCTEGGHLNILGYTTRPNYDESIRTVYVPIFGNRVIQTGPLRGLEFRLTEDVIREIEAKTPYKTTSNREQADTELIGTITAISKNILNRNQLNEVREYELVLNVELYWRDLRPEANGALLSGKQSRDEVLPKPPMFDPNLPPPEPVRPPIKVVTVLASGRVVPELGESTASGLTAATRRMATQIVQAMEKPW
jgi:hypothetical protein